MIFDFVLEVLALLMLLFLLPLLCIALYIAGVLICDAWHKHMDRKQEAQRAARHKAYAEDLFRQIRNAG